MLPLQPKTDNSSNVGTGMLTRSRKATPAKSALEEKSAQVSSSKKVILGKRQGSEQTNLEKGSEAIQNSTSKKRDSKRENKENIHDTRSMRNCKK
jgi:type IV secretory pathway TrbL component